MLKIRMLRVKEGDCLWIDYGMADPPSRVLIDGGPGNSTALREEIEAELEKVETLHFELLVVTHIDTDHIVGIVNLLRDLPAKVTFGEIWFNTYQHLLAADQLGGGDLAERVVAAILDPRAKGIEEALKVPDLLGAPDGENLAQLLAEAHPDSWNSRFPPGAPSGNVRGRAIVIRDQGPLPSISLDGGARITLLSPGKEQLAELADAWEALLGGDAGHGMGDLLGGDDEGEDEHGAPDLLGKKDVWPPDIHELAGKKPKKDPSKNNGSSIAFLFEYGEAKVLFGADAFASVLSDNIRRLFDDRPELGPRLKLSAFKLSHHGSAKNLTNELLELIECETYLISTDGTRHAHPDHEALARVLVHGGPNPRLHFNARVPTTENWDGTRPRAEWPSYSAIFPPDDGNERGLDIDLPH